MLTNTFETSATTAEANNLVLSVLNTGEYHSTLQHIAKAMIQGSMHGQHTFKSVVTTEVQKQRKTGSKFKPQHITEAGNLVQAGTIQSVLEGMLQRWTGDTIVIQGRLWWDNSAGNTYWSAWVQIPQKTGEFASFTIPMSYGYGDQWKCNSIELLKKIGFFTGQEGFSREYPILWDYRGHMLKRDMFKGLYL